MKQITFNKDQVIFRENDFATVMYDIVSGKVGIFTGYQTDQEKKIAELEAGTFFGEMGMIEFYPRSATAVALIFIWTKDMEISTETRTIKVIWDKHQDSDEPDLPDYIQIPADLPDEDVYLYLTKHYGYTPISWDNLK